MPSSTQLLVGFIASLEEAADVSSNHGNSEHVHVHHSADGVSHEVPGGPVVSCPVGSELARPGECRSGDNKGSFRIFIKYELTLSCLCLLKPIKRVKIVLYLLLISTVLGVQRNSLILEID